MTQKKVEEDKENSNDMRIKAMESLGETKRRKGDEEKKGKKRRSNGSEYLQYLTEKNELMAKFRMENKALEERKLKEESTRHDEFGCYFQNMFQIKWFDFFLKHGSHEI